MMKVEFARGENSVDELCILEGSWNIFHKKVKMFNNITVRNPTLNNVVFFILFFKFNKSSENNLIQTPRIVQQKRVTDEKSGTKNFQH